MPFPPLPSFCVNVVPDGRRLIRPLFMETDGKTPLPSKRYYDVFTVFLTQATFAFTVAPFIFLSFRDSLMVWTRVYFYALLGIGACFAMFSRKLPFRGQFLKAQNARTANIKVEVDVAGIKKVAREEVKREGLSKREQRAPTLGLPEDPEGELNEIVAEVKREIEERKRRGSLGAQGFDVKKMVDEKIRQFKKK